MYVSKLIIKYRAIDSGGVGGVGQLPPPPPALDPKH